VINFDTGEKQFFGGGTEPFDDVMLKIKSTSDSILIAYFGIAFFKKHVQWDVNDSHYYSENNHGRWFDVPSEKPNRFLLRYFVKLDRQHKYSIIEFELDRNGRIISGDKTKGLIKCNGDCRFGIDYSKAIDVAKRNGLKLKDARQYACLSWTKSKSPADQNNFVGNYEIVVAEFNRTEEVENGIIDLYDIVIIDPWSGRFLRKSELDEISIF
jgi:hypothetical protein